MNFFPRIRSQVRSWWKTLTHRAQIEAEVSEELQFHIDARAEELVRSGATPEEAARRARVELGQPSTQGEKYREAIGLRPLDSLGGDIRYGLRSLQKIPASPSWPCSHSRWESAQPRPCLAWYTLCCSIPCPTPTGNALYIPHMKIMTGLARNHIGSNSVGINISSW